MKNKLENEVKCINTNKSKIYSVDDVDCNWIGQLEFEDAIKCNDLVELEYANKKRFYVVYSEDKEIQNEDYLILEEITEDEHTEYSLTWENVASHVALATNDMYIN